MSNEIKELAKRLHAFCVETRRIKVEDVQGAADALEALVAERDSLREVIDHLSFNWIDCPHCDRNKELVESFIKEEKKEI